MLNWCLNNALIMHLSWNFLFPVWWKFGSALASWSWTPGKDQIDIYTEYCYPFLKVRLWDKVRMNSCEKSTSDISQMPRVSAWHLRTHYTTTAVTGLQTTQLLTMVEKIGNTIHNFPQHWTLNTEISVSLVFLNMHQPHRLTHNSSIAHIWDAMPQTETIKDCKRFTDCNSNLKRTLVQS